MLKDYCVVRCCGKLYCYVELFDECNAYTRRDLRSIHTDINGHRYVTINRKRIELDKLIGEYLLRESVMNSRLKEGDK